MKAEKLEIKIKTLENQIRTLQDIHAIETLQRAYGYYLERWMAQEIIDLFSDGPGVVLYFNGEGSFLGKEGVARYFNHVESLPELMHQVMQVSGIVDVAPDGKTAKGRWYGYGKLVLPEGGGVNQQQPMSGIYEMEYVKENGVWKIKVLRFNGLWGFKSKEGFVKPERIAAIDPNNPHINPAPDSLPEIPPQNTHYPSGYIFPFHYKHPVTGKDTSENEWNESLGLAPKKKVK